MRTTAPTAFRLLALTGGLLAASAAQAYDFNALATLQSQDEFKRVAQDLSATLAFKPLAPAEGLGVLGFDLNASIGATTIDSKDLLQRAAGGHDVPGTLPTFTLRAQKGLPLDIDVGLSYTALVGTSGRAVSGDIKWAFLPGSTVMPAVAVRAFYTQMSGLGDLKLRSQGVDVSVSKGFAMVTPYAGVGVVASQASTDSGTWAKESYTQGRVFAGVNANLAVVNLAGEVDQTGKDSSVSVKLGWRF